MVAGAEGGSGITVISWTSAAQIESIQASMEMLKLPIEEKYVWNTLPLPDEGTPPGAVQVTWSGIVSCVELQSRMCPTITCDGHCRSIDGWINGVKP